MDEPKQIAVARTELRTAIDAVVGHHMNPFRSGVARFNEMLAEALAVPLLKLGQEAAARSDCPLFSFKVGELDPVACEQLAAVLVHDRREGAWCVFLHDFGGLPLECRLVADAARVWCGNHAVHAAVRALTDRAEIVWVPGLVADLRRFEPATIQVFSFGMAHKIRTDMFRKLRGLLDASGETYALYVSNANHETATMEDAQLVYSDMHKIFPRRLYFMGNLSDVAVYNQLVSTTYFAAFFDPGVRANNTSVASAMEHGAVVITNLDEHSPAEFVHMDNVIDIGACEELPSDPLVLKQISVRAMETARARDWEQLVQALRASEP